MSVAIEISNLSPALLRKLDKDLHVKPIVKDGDKYQKNVKLVIGISTDKSSPPVRNIYGMTKSLMERMFCLMEGKSDTHFVCVRYGNVAWSTGSVLGIWKKMLKNQVLPF